MELALSGINASTGLLSVSGGPSSSSSVTGGSHHLKHSSDEFKIIRWLLRDTLICGYRDGLRDGLSGDATSIPPPMDPELQKACHAMIKLALILSSNQSS